MTAGGGEGYRGWSGTSRGGDPANAATIRPVWYAGSDTVVGELWTMLHPPYTAMVLAFVVLGAVVAPKLSYPLLGGTALAYLLGLGVGAHFLDQIPGMGSRYVVHWSERALWVGGLLGVGGGVALGLVAAEWYVGLPLLAFVVTEGVCAVGYPLAPLGRGLLHRPSVFAVAWGGLPFLTSYYAQARGLGAIALLLAAGCAVAAAGELWLSRKSRTLRAVRARGRSDRSAVRGAVKPPYRAYDRALQILAGLTVAAATALLAVRALLVS